LSPTFVSIPTKYNRVAALAGESEVAGRTRLANARFHRLLEYCANALGETLQATEELSRRVHSLRIEIERQRERP
jgi:hypothetical protein